MNWSPPALRRTAATLVSLLVPMLALALAPAAHAAESYTASTLPCSAANDWGSGGTDQAGATYLACNGSVYRYVNGTGTVVATLPGVTQDIAPSPDSSYLYYFRSDDVARMVRQPNGTYQMDAGWKLDTYIEDGLIRTVRARSIAVDAWGDLYLSNGGWFNGQPNTVLKYRPDGKLVTKFGEWGLGIGQFAVNMGIAVTRDGRTVYVSENENNRVQRFDYSGGTYVATSSLGARDQQDLDCTKASNFSAPYDVAVDPWGYLYVMDTSCERVLKFTPTGQPLGTVGRVTAGLLAHGVAVDNLGNFFLGQTGQRFMRGADNPIPGPAPAPEPLPASDTTAPVVTSVTIPDPTPTQAVAVTIVASDNVAVTEMRMAREDGAWGNWTAFATPTTVTLSAGYGVKGLSVQVRDASGNVSNVIYRTTTWTAPVDPDPNPQPGNVAPTIRSVSIPDTTTSQIITVTVDAADDKAVTQVRTANEDGTWGPWREYSTSLRHALTPSAGIKGVSVQVRDEDLNESATVYRTLRYAPEPVAGPDIADPVLVSATIPATTTTASIEATLSATDDVGVTQVRFANEDGNWAAWQAYATTKAWTLSSGYGDKLVFVQVRDASGKESNRMTLRTSLLPNQPVIGGNGDTIAPSLHSIELPRASSRQEISIRIDATDNRGVAQVRVANEDGTWGPWSTYSNRVTWTLSAGYTYKLVTVQVRDAAGNESTTITRSTQLVLSASAADDRQAPVLRNLSIPMLATTQSIAVVLDATDDVGVTQARFANEDGNWTAWQAYGPGMTWKLSKGDGLYKLVFAQVRDASGKESNVIYHRTLLQLESPVAQH